MSDNRATYICFDLSKDAAIVPTECESKELRELLGYFQYRAPNIDATQSPLLNVTKHADVLKDICLGNEERYVFCAQNAKTESELAKVTLSGTMIEPLPKRFLCKKMTHAAKRDDSRSETDLECLLRHLRNALAHGRVYKLNISKGCILFFEDMSKNGNPAARIVCGQSDLKKWRAILNKALKEQNPSSS